jgi:hypothetical protein
VPSVYPAGILKEEVRSVIFKITWEKKKEEFSEIGIYPITFPRKIVGKS